MNISKISAKNNSFGLKLGPEMEKHIKHTAATLNKVAEGRLLAAIIDAHTDNTNAIKTICPQKTIELVSDDFDNKIRKYKIYEPDNQSKPDIIIETTNDNLWYSKLLTKLKQL